MPTTPAGLRRVAARLNPDSTPDGELLARFLEHRDEAAFAELVRRHAAMVLGTCRRVLGNVADAEDAFQAAFVVLVRRASGLTDRACVGNFLYGVAFHTALKAKAMTAKRRTREARSKRPDPPLNQSELLTALDEELANLPAKYREPVVLCELEGRSRREVASTLGIAEGTISSRLASAHRMLEKRLRSRGFAGVGVAGLLAEQAHAVADSLAHAAVHSAVAGPPANVSQLASEVTKMLFLQKLGVGSAILTTLAVVVALAAGAEGPKAKVADPPPKVTKLDQPKPAPAPEPAWKAEFRKIYGLKEGEFVRRVPPPYAECRTEFIRDHIRRMFADSKQELPDEAKRQDHSDYFCLFGWKDGWVDEKSMHWRAPVKPEEGVSLRHILHAMTGWGKHRFDASADLLETKVTGDWVVRAGADREKIMQALEPILRKECGLKVSVALVETEREVFVLSGKYVAKPLSDIKVGEIQIYGAELTDRDTGGGGSGNLQEMIAHVEGWIEFPIVLGKVEDAPRDLQWRFHYRSPFTDQQHAEDKDPASVMNNLALQTGLTVKKEKQKIRVLVVKKSE